MPVAATTARRGSAAALVVAAVALVAYPVMRGYGVETGLAGAAAYARPAWLWAHVLGMVGLTLTAVGLAGVDRVAHRLALTAIVLVLPYYGAEAYGLHALGRHALAARDASAVDVADAFRFEPVAMTTFAAGLLLLVGVAARLLWLGERAPGSRPAVLPRAGLWLTAFGLATYLPQFFTPGAVRIGHGALLAAGLLLLALTLALAPARDTPDQTDRRAARDRVTA